MKKSQSVDPLQQYYADMRNGYEAARSSRFRRRRTGVVPTGSGADYHYRSEGDYLKLMEQARDMDRNDTIVGQAVDRAVDNRVQGGYALAWATGDDALDKDLQQRWDDEAEDEDVWDIAGEMCFADFERMTARQPLVDGDVLVLPTRSGALQLNEGHRLRTPSGTRRNVVHGVLLDDGDRPRRRLEYWFTRDDIDPNMPLNKVGDIVRYPARDADGNKQVFQVYDPKRVTQTRGVTAFAPIFDCLGMFEDINFARLVQQQVVSCFALMRTRTAEHKPTGKRNARGNQTVDTHQPTGTRRITEGIAPGMEWQGAEGEKLEGFSPNTPNPEFFDHVRLILTMVGINLGMPLVMVLMDASETNFSGYRGAVDQARLSFRRQQRSQIRRFHNPVTDFRLRHWAASDPALRRRLEKLALRRNQNLYRWQPPAWPYIEPLKDVTSDAAKLANHLTSPRRLHKERHGTTWEEISQEIVDDNGALIAKAMTKADELNAGRDKAQQVTWREILALLPQPKITLTGTLDDAPDNQQA